MENLSLVIDIAVALAAATAMGVAAVYLRQPIILGYLVAGILIGPYALGLVSDVAQVNTIAEIGVILLLFAVGVEFSFSRLSSIRNVALFGGLLQIAITAAFGALIGRLLGWSFSASIFFGFLIALSSTMVVLKLLSERGDLDTIYGRIILGILIVQDISLVPLIVILPALARPIGSVLPELGFAIFKAVVFLLVMFYGGTRLIPWIMAKVAATNSRELFLLVTVTIALGAAFATSVAGLSIALGAFVAGLIISESDFRHQIVGEIVPLRDIFSVLFFTSIGMLVQPLFIMNNAVLIIGVVLLVIVGKTIITSLIPIAFGYVGRVGPFVGLSLFQVGEFSFVLAATGVAVGVLDGFQYGLFLATAVLTILATPAGLHFAPRLAILYDRLPFPFTGLAGRVGVAAGDIEELSGHAVICGLGDTGRSIGRTLGRRGFRYLVIDINPRVVESFRLRGVPAIYGDAANPHILKQARLERAKVMVVTMPDPIATARAVQIARSMNERLDIVVETTVQKEIETLRHLGAREVVYAEFEAGLELMRHTLIRFGLTSYEAQSIVQRQRAEGGEVPWEE